MLFNIKFQPQYLYETKKQYRIVDTILAFGMLAAASDSVVNLFLLPAVFLSEETTYELHNLNL